MRYLLMICGKGQEPEPVDTADGADVDSLGIRPVDIDTWVEETTADGTRILGDRLRPAAEASTVRIRDGKLLVTDGPFAETVEQLGGIDVIECADRDAAVAIAARHPMARGGRVEVWPFWQD